MTNAFDIPPTSGPTKGITINALGDAPKRFVTAAILAKAVGVAPRPWPRGWMTAVGFIIFGVQRFLMEFLRSTSPSFIPGMSQAQIISIVLTILGLVMLYKIYQRKEQVREAGPS